MKAPDAGNRGKGEAPPKGDLRQYFRLSTIGIEIGVALAIGILIGWWLDNRVFTGTKPWLTILFALFGIAAGFRNIIRLARKDWDEEADGRSGNERR